ncbi:MAG: ATP-binding protein [Alphaproteobacteria bacterium]|nr:ATP-binding protein [Alphaproteobacteria bacterium]
MKVKLGQAVKMFFGNSSLEMVYFEAIANALDAGATEINIDIKAKAFNQPETIQIGISDNGFGFTDDRYKKFSNLFDVDENSHKGLGRLVYLCYFDTVKVTSNFDDTFKREFDFTETFSEEDAKVIIVPKTKSGTILQMSSYTLSKLKKYDFLLPTYLKNRILEEFYSRLFKLKQEKKIISIKIKSNIENKQLKEELNNEDIPVFETVELDSPINIFDKFYLHYSIIEVEPDKSSLIAAVSVDNRTFKVEIIAQENIPMGYNMVFLLYSDWFIGKVDNTRQNLAISDSDFQSIQNIFRSKVASIIEERIPKITERNNQTKNNLINRFPHLSGYFNTKSIGYISRADVLKKAQDNFFKAQKDLLDANYLSDEQYEKSIELSARALTEYILFRQITIENLKKTTDKNSEAEIHKMFATMSEQFDKDNSINDLYRNNAWLLDDKYMTYETVLSNKELGELIKYITTDENTSRDDDRPDIALVFSNNPNDSKNFDIVIVELKKRGITLEENMKAITQLEKRARKLMKFYKNKIQRIWYYGIIEFNDEVELALTGEYKELYSSGKMYYKETKVAIQKNPDLILPIGIFMWDIDAVVSDADARNSAFLNLIKSKFITE